MHGPQLTHRAVLVIAVPGLKAAARMTTLWAVAIAALLALVLAFFGPLFIDGLTVDISARAAARAYLPWAAAAPLFGVWA